MTSAKPAIKPEEEIVAPAKIRAGHTQERGLGAAIDRDHGWENIDEHPLGRARYGKPQRIDDDEYNAGNVYRAFYTLRGRSGQSSLVMVDGGRSDTPFTQTQVDAIRIIEKLEKFLGDPYARIVRNFCGEGETARKACALAGEGDQRKTWELIRLSLAKLGTAIEKLRIPWQRAA